MRYSTTDIVPIIYGHGICGHGHVHGLGHGHVVIAMYLLTIGVGVWVAIPVASTRISVPSVRLLVPSVVGWGRLPGVTSFLPSVGPRSADHGNDERHCQYTNEETSRSHMLTSFFSVLQG